MSEPKWRDIERDYRAGVKSIRAIGREYGVPESNIRNRASQLGWKRLGQQSVERASKQLTSSALAQNAVTPDEAIDAGAQVIVQVNHRHRAQLGKLWNRAANLLNRLEAMEVLREQLIEGHIESPEKQLRVLAQETMLLQALTDISIKIVDLERKMFGLDQASVAESPLAKALTEIAQRTAQRVSERKQVQN